MYFTTEERKLLLDLFHLYAPSNKEEPVLNFIKKILDEAHIPYNQDKNGNIICFNYEGEPLLSAHTDCVGTAEAGHYVKLIDIYPYGDDEIMKGIGNIGGDDKCGVFLILLYLLSGKPINAVFSICEEIGGMNGIKTVVDEVKDNEVWKSIPYAIVLDRKNPGDIICYKNDYGSQKFEDALAKIGKEYGYEPVLGGCSDMNTLRNYMNGCNLSVGYFNPHSNTEFVSLTDLYNCWNYLNKLIDEMPRDLPLEEKKTASYYNGSYYNGYGNYNYYGKKGSVTNKDLYGDYGNWPGYDDYY